MPATLDGHVNIPAGGAINLVVRFFTPDTDTEQFRACSPTDANGAFTIYGIPPGTYDVGVKSDKSLSILAEDKVFTEGNTTDINFGDLALGDLSNDDYVTLSDRTILYAYWGLGGDCAGYSGDWLMPQCPSPPPAGGACHGYVIT
jgi:hypothetical protein